MLSFLDQPGPSVLRAAGVLCREGPERLSSLMLYKDHWTARERRSSLGPCRFTGRVTSVTSGGVPRTGGLALSYRAGQGPPLPLLLGPLPSSKALPGPVTSPSVRLPPPPLTRSQTSPCRDTLGGLLKTHLLATPPESLMQCVGTRD